MAALTPRHTTAAERLAATEARLGRKIWLSSECPDDLARALWWHRRKATFAAILDDLGHDDDQPGYFTAVDERDEAAERQRTLLDLMRNERRMLRLVEACVTRTEALVHLMTDRATERAMEALS